MAAFVAAEEPKKVDKRGVLAGYSGLGLGGLGYGGLGYSGLGYGYGAPVVSLCPEKKNTFLSNVLTS